MSDERKLGKTGMSSALRYWSAIAIDAAGRRTIEEIPSAKAFFLAAFPEFTVHSQVPDTLIQRQLLNWIREGTQSPIPKPNSQQINVKSQIPINEQLENATQSFLAKICLKCFISSQIERVCQQLVAQFGQKYGFTCSDLLPLVLDEDHRRYAQAQTTAYQSLAEQILQSFDPQQSSLATWTSRRVKHHKELNAFLLEHGIYLVSDWAILNDTTSKQLERIFSQFHQLTTVEIQECQQLLASYHAIYRTQRLQGRQGGTKSPCAPPTPEQLQQINQHLSQQNHPQIPPAILTAKLQKIASLLREYRIYVRGGSLPREEADSRILATTIPADNSDTIDEQTEFLQLYHQEFVTCLDQVITQVISHRVSQLQRQDPEKAQQFLKALELFHCQKLSMTEIAAQLGLKAQFHVSRLLKLKAFRADIQRELLMELRDRIMEKAQAYINPQNLQTCDQQTEQALKIAEALNELIVKVFEQAEIEASTATRERNKAQTSLFAQRLCLYLAMRKNQS